MSLSDSDRHQLVETLRLELNGKTDGGNKNLLLPYCPWCRHDGYKYGIRILPSSGKRRFGSSHCFHCGRSSMTLGQTLTVLGREDLIPHETTQLDEGLTVELKLFEDELDDETVEVEMPKGYKRQFKNPYLKSRGWRADDYSYFEVGTNRGMSWPLEDYVIIPIVENKKHVGYVARHTWSKEEIEKYNEHHRHQILRYRNSTEGNGFEKLIYNIDAIIPGVTDTVIVCEGVFDVVGLTRKLELYDNEKIQAIATFGKKISEVQMYKLQSKGVKTLVIGYDQDATETTGRLIKTLERWFDVYVVNIPQDWECKDFDEMSVDDLYELFSEHILTVREFNLEGVL